MKLFVDGTEYCDATIDEEWVEALHDFGQAAAIDQIQKFYVRLTKRIKGGISVGAPKSYELREGKRCLPIHLAGSTDADLGIEVWPRGPWQDIPDTPQENASAS